MQRIQVCSEPARSHAAPLLHRLLWLPISKRMKYKLCVLMFDVFHGTAPGYFADLCSRYNDHRIRSSVRGNFTVRRTRTHFADGSFVVAGPAAWNSLSTHIRNIHTHAAFCRHLKTYLFSSPGWLTLITNIYLYTLILLGATEHRLSGDIVNSDDDDGWRLHSGCSTSLLWLFIGVFGTELQLVLHLYRILETPAH